MRQELRALQHERRDSESTSVSRSKRSPMARPRYPLR